ncbi:MAG: hypothetical protein R3E95_17310 [Thiolinea sp.]
MLLEHFDQPRNSGSVIILGDYVHNPVAHFRSLYPQQRIIIYQLEQMVGSETWHSVTKIISHIQGADEIWDYDHLNAEFLSWHGVQVNKIIPILYTQALENIPYNSHPEIDVLFYGYINERRYRILRMMQQEFYNQHSIVWLYGISGKALDRYIANSKVILNLHAFEPWHRQEQVRIFYPIINQKLVISETSQKNYFDDSIVEADGPNLASTIKYWLQDERWIEKSRYAKRKFQQLSNAWLENNN